MFPSDQPRASLGVFFAPETMFGLNESYSLYFCTIDARWAFAQVLLEASPGQALVFDKDPSPDGGLLTSGFDVGPLLLRHPVFISQIHGLLLSILPGSTLSPSQYLAIGPYSTPLGRFVSKGTRS
jgi:hypothetical protein